MPADNIARVVSDIRAARIDLVDAYGDDPERQSSAQHAAAKIAAHGPVIDATSVYRQIMRSPGRDIYSHCLLPPFNYATVAYENDHGNIHVAAMTTMSAADWREAGEAAEEAPDLADDTWARWSSDKNAVDWDDVKYVTAVFLFIGGFGNGRPIERPVGPVVVWRWAIYQDGTPADLNWVDPRSDPRGVPTKTWADQFIMPLGVTLGAIDFLNCRNVEIVEPQRPRHERRRIERTGVRVNEINVFPVGRTTRSSRGEPVGGVPLHRVRGHFVKYGPEFGRGLLFGKYAGRFWVPQHARGEREAGESEQSYNLRTEAP